MRQSAHLAVAALAGSLAAAHCRDSMRTAMQQHLRKGVEEVFGREAENAEIVGLIAQVRFDQSRPRLVLCRAAVTGSASKSCSVHFVAVFDVSRSLKRVPPFFLCLMLAPAS